MLVAIHISDFGGETMQLVLLVSDDLQQEQIPTRSSKMISNSFSHRVSRRFNDIHRPAYNWTVTRYLLSVGGEVPSLI